MTGGLETAVVVLAGGVGRRMGGGKPMRRFGDTTLLARALELAHSYGAPVAVAVRAAGQVRAQVGVPLLLDDRGIEGPIAGLASALAFGAAKGAGAVLTLPCDAPLLPPDLAARLGAALTPSVHAAVATSGGQLHPTCALWRVDSLDLIPDYLRDGRRSLRGFAEASGMVIVDWPVVDVDPFANANTPEDLRRMREISR